MSILPFKKPLYGPSDTHTSLVNPKAPKGGTIRLHASGTRTSFNSLNPYLPQGIPAAGVELHLHATLLKRPLDDPQTAYGYVAEDVSFDGNKVCFKLRSKAAFHDGSPIRPKDMIFTFNLLKSSQVPLFYETLLDVESCTVAPHNSVCFTYNRPVKSEDAFFLGTLPALSEEYYKKHNFLAVNLEKPMGSGPYTIESMEPGVSITWARVKNWWGENLLTHKGCNNFDKITYLYFPDAIAALEAFKKHLYDIRIERISAFWHKEYNFSAVKKGFVRKIVARNLLPFGLNNIFINTRRPHLADVHVRKALTLLMDFEWINKHMMYGLYKRNPSIFLHTPYGLQDGEALPKGPDLKDPQFLPESAEEDTMPIEKRVICAQEHLKKAGYILKGGKLYNPKNNQPLVVELILSSPPTAKLLQHYVRTLKKVGITLKIRTLDAVEFLRRKEAFDYDMIYYYQPEVFVPDKGQYNLWGMEAANRPGSNNLAGVKSPLVDAQIDKILQSLSENELKVNAKQLDQLIQWGYFSIPMWHTDNIYMAYWKGFAYQSPLAAGSIEKWWSLAP